MLVAVQVVVVLELHQLILDRVVAFVVYILSSSDVEDDDDEGTSADIVLACIKRFIAQKHVRTGRVDTRRRSQPNRSLTRQGRAHLV